MKFNNNASMVGFIGDYKSVKEVVAVDTKELEEIEGSFEAVADRMREIIDFADRKKGPSYDEWSSLVDRLMENFVEKYGSNWAENPEAWKLYGIERNKIMARFSQSRFDNRVAVTNYMTTKGFQECPFEGCNGLTWNEEITIFNYQTYKSLVINRGTEHLARDHHLLEKGNQYGISAKEFYEHFMPSTISKK